MQTQHTNQSLDLAIYRSTDIAIYRLIELAIYRATDLAIYTSTKLAIYRSTDLAIISSRHRVISSISLVTSLCQAYKLVTSSCSVVPTLVVLAQALGLSLGVGERNKLAEAAERFETWRWVCVYRERGGGGGAHLPNFYSDFPKCSL